ncbi:MAG: hypothetical protein U9R75_07890, partial [Candidatus Thermoplasmatota archaeon]|nr:hypothetical protein [Candidatus Thermoplasmatota archaeon]
MDLKMIGKNEDILIFTLGYLQENEEQVVRTTDDLADSLEISNSTITRYFKKLIERNLITRKNQTKNLGRFELTEKGKDMYLKLFKETNEIILTPEQHEVGRICSMKPIIQYITDSLIIIKIVYYTIRRKNLNIPQLLERYSFEKKGSRFQSFLDEVLSSEDVDDKSNLEDMMTSVTQLGIKPEHIDIRINDPDRYKAALATAEFNLRSGNLDEAISIYSNILGSTRGLEPNVWIVAYSRYLRCLMNNGEHEKVISLVDENIPHIKNCIHKAVILQEKANSLAFNKKYDLAKKFYDYCTGVYNKKNLPVLQTTLKNNLGVLYFRRGKIDQAEKQWIEAERIAKRKKILWMKAIICMNLGDLFSHHRGQVKRGKERIRRARKIMESLKDMEGIADSHFNYSLALIDEGNIKL